MRIADVAIVTLVIASGFSWIVNRTSAMFLFTLVGLFLGGWYAMLRLLGYIPNARNRQAARKRWFAFLRRPYRRK